MIAPDFEKNLHSARRKVALFSIKVLHLYRCYGNEKNDTDNHRYGEYACRKVKHSIRASYAPYPAGVLPEKKCLAEPVISSTGT